MVQNVTEYCHVCKSQTTSGPPVVTGDKIERLDTSAEIAMGDDEKSFCKKVYFALGDLIFLPCVLCNSFNRVLTAVIRAFSNFAIF